MLSFKKLKDKKTEETHNKIIPSFIAIIAGPGGKAFNSDHIGRINNILVAAGIKTLVIGDGESPLTEDTIISKIKKIKSAKDLTLYFIAHGYRTEKGKHIIWLDEKANTDTCGLLKKINKVRNKQRTNFIFTASYGSVLLPKISKKLPSQSFVTILSPESKLITGEEIVNLMSKVYTNKYLIPHHINHAKAVCLYPINDSDLPPTIIEARKGTIACPKTFEDLKIAGNYKQNIFSKLLGKASA